MESPTISVQTILKDVEGLTPSQRMNHLAQINDDHLREGVTAVWACREGFEALRPKPLPTPIPQRLREYYAFAPHVRKMMNDTPEKYGKFWNNSEVQLYLDMKQKITEQNKGNLEWLQWILQRLGPEYEKERSAVKFRILEFQDYGKPTAWEE